MKKYFLLVSSFLCLNTYTVLATVVTTTSCEGKCTIFCDNETKDCRIAKNPDVPDGEEVIIPASETRSNFFRSLGKVHNMTIEEGITGSKNWGLATYNIVVGAKDSILKLPSTFKSEAGQTPFWDLIFGTIDASVLKDTILNLPTEAEQIVILDPDSNVKVIASGAYGANPPITVQCKGSDLQACQNMVKTSKVLSVKYYKGYDDKGNILEEWGPNGKTTYTYKYDSGGNLVGCVDSHGNRIYGKKIYTIEEAEAATAYGTKFHVGLTYK